MRTATAFFEKVLGKWMKYGGLLWPQGVDSLDKAEEAMLELTCERAQLEDGMEIWSSVVAGALFLGGWQSNIRTAG